MKKIIPVLFLLIMIFCAPVVSGAEDIVYTASVDGEVSLHIAPSAESYEIMKIPACSAVTVLEKDKTWYLVSYENKIGWINTSYTRAGYKKAAEATGLDTEKLIEVIAESGVTQLYKTPDDDVTYGQKGIYSVPAGIVLEITNETPNGWGLVCIDDDYMWIKLSETKEFVKDIDIEKYELHTIFTLSPDGKGVTMWEQANEGKACAVIPDCTDLVAREESGEYIYVSYGGMNGWINRNYTTTTLYNAQIQAGEAVNRSYRIDSEAYGEDVDLLSVPSYKDEVDTKILCSIKSNSVVYVLRRVKGDWSLVQHNDKLGWLPPGSLLKESVEENDKDITALKQPQVGYISTPEKKGLKLLTKAGGGDAVAYLPETAEITVLAKKGDYKYVICDYASGWAKNVILADSAEESLRTDIGKKHSAYVLNNQSVLMSMPTNEEKLGSIVICMVEEGTSLTPLRFVHTAEEKWALVEYNGNTGWISITEDSEGLLLIVMIVLACVLLAGGTATYLIIKKKKNLKKFTEEFSEEKREEVENDEKDVRDGDRRPQEESANVSGK